MSAGEVTFQLNSIIAVITATFETQERRHAWASSASPVCLLLWIIIATGLVFYYQAFLLRRAIPSVVTVVVPTLAWALVVYNEGFDIGGAFYLLPAFIEFGLVSLVVSQMDELSKSSRDDDRVSSKIGRSPSNVFIKAPRAANKPVRSAQRQIPKQVEINIWNHQHRGGQPSQD